MKRYRLEEMTRGWFVGAFQPAALSTDAVEVGVKHYPAGAYEDAHFHKIAAEVTLILTGQAEMNGELLEAGDIVALSPGEIADFRTLTPVTTVVVKLPGALNDKYPPETEKP
jgi:hypothetical protein